MVRLVLFLRLMEDIIRLVRFFATWTVRVMLFTLQLVLTSFVSLWRGVPQSVRNIANEWHERARLAGFPGDWDRQLWYVLYGAAFATIVIGWVILSYLTVWIVGMIL